MGVGVVIAAAGSSRRMGALGSKVFLPLGGKPIIMHSLELFLTLPEVQEIVVVTRAADVGVLRKLLGEESREKTIRIVAGGKERQESVYLGLQALSGRTPWVLIHDGARPFLTEEVVRRALGACFHKQAVGVAVPVKDTIKVVREGVVVRTPKRAELWAMQTPQVFSYQLISQAHQDAQRLGLRATDDCALLENLDIPVHIVRGDYANIKITTPEDLPRESSLRIGFGIDVHRLAGKRPLILGGVEIPFELGLLGHSDADVVTHAIIDALLGAAGKGDLGEFFPDTDPAYRGVSSLVLLRQTLGILSQEKLRINNIDVTILAQKPKISPWKNQMRRTLAAALAISESQLNIKASTTEGLGFLGREEGIAAQAVVSLRQGA